MTCRDAERLIDTFFDGELDGRLMREAALHVTRCKRCEREVEDRDEIHDLLVASIEADLDPVDLGCIWEGVDAAIGSGARRTSGPSGSWLRLAAGSSRMTGMLVGGRAAVETDADLDPAGEWLDAPGAAGRRRSWSLAGAAALAASILVAVLLTTGRVSHEDQIATPATAPSEPASAIAMASPRTQPVQVESVNFAGGSLAMWNEPETDTTVIWLEDDGSAAAGQR